MARFNGLTRKPDLMIEVRTEMASFLEARARDGDASARCKRLLPCNRLLTHSLILAALLLSSCSTPQLNGPTAPKGDPNAGVLTLPNGRNVSVYPYELSYTGVASYAWPDGRVYRGTFTNGLADGIGDEYLPSGEHYSGSWSKGMREGQGTLELPDQSRYEGGFHENARSGLGTLTNPEKGSYQGQWQKDLPEGEGQFDYTDGSIYQGHWSQGRRNGYGRYQRPDGSDYQGDWLNDIPHGFGKVIEANGVSYDGGWVSGKRQGYGIGRSSAEITYEGMWIANKRSGYGREDRPDGSTYIGEWQEDKRHGQGLATRADGTRHEGYWENNSPQGPGTRTNATGVVITGLWNGSHVSAGILTLPGGEQYSGTLYRDNNQTVDAGFLAWLKQKADHGNGFAQLLLGIAYSQYEKPKKDLNDATRWFSLAAEKGIAEAEYLLGEIFLSRKETRARGLELLLKAASQNHSAASLRIGTLYQLGEYLPKNHALARQYYESASLQGNIVARNNLAWLLATSPDENVRDGKRAVQLARPIAFLFNSWGYMDTLAAALAESGDWPHAIEMQRRAIEIAREGLSEKDNSRLTQQVQQMQDRIALFEQKQAFREP